MWLIEALFDGFESTIPAWNYGLFRVLFGIACVIKVVVELRHGHQDFFSEGGFLGYLYRAVPHRFEIPAGLYTATFPVKMLGAFMLVGGIGVRIASIMMAIAFVVEFLVYFKFHTNLYFLISVAFALVPPVELSLAPSGLVLVSGSISSIEPGQCSPLGPAMVVGAMTAVYWGTAYRKMNRSFSTGGVVYHHLKSVLDDRQRRHHLDGWYPAWLVRFVQHGDEHAVRRVFAPFMWTTVGLELLLPLMLSNSYTYGLGFALGVAMHAGFTFLFPELLLSFSMTTISIYVLFADPRAMIFYLG